MEDIYNLQRFLDAQMSCFERVVRELSAGQKRSYWMWYIFPQVIGLGHSSMAKRYAIFSKGEAAAYLEHPVLGDRLRQCTRLVNAVEGRGIGQIFGFPNDLKFHSSVTLFMTCSTGDNPFKEALDKYFDGKPDDATLEILKTI